MPALALAIGLLIMYLRRGSRLSTDTVIGIIFSAVVAFGLAIVSRNREASRGINMFLYGDILTIGDNEIALLACLLVAFLAFQFFAWNRMLHISVNEQIAGVHRIPVALYQYLFAGLLSLVVILCVRAVGVLLVTAILIVPAATARNLARNSRQLFFLSLVFSYISCAGGLLISAQPWANVPAGAAIVLLACAMFAVSFVAARFRSK
jgi:zinc transport system permease protein